LTRGKSKSCSEKEIDYRGIRMSLKTIELDRGMPFSTAVAILTKDKFVDGNGFYRRRQGNKQLVYLALYDVKEMSGKFLIYKPHTGAVASKEERPGIGGYERCSQEDAEHGWNAQYEASLTTCIHVWL
jgi:hypothetical protein